jgi:hypothetical protein
MSILTGYLTEAELSAELKKSQRTVQLWRQQRKGPPWTAIGKSIFYSEDGVRAWLKAQEHQPIRSRRARTEIATSA